MTLDALLCDDADAANASRAAVEVHCMMNGCKRRFRLAEWSLPRLPSVRLTLLDEFDGFVTRHIFPEEFPDESVHVRASGSSDGIFAANAHSAEGNLVDLAAVLLVPTSDDDAGQELVSVVEYVVLDLRRSLFHQRLLSGLVPESIESAHFLYGWLGPVTYSWK